MSDNTSLNDLLVKQLLDNQRKDRRWKNIRFFILLLLVLSSFFLGTQLLGTGNVSDDNQDQPYVAFIRLSGYIFPGSAFSAEHVVPLLNDAFADTAAEGVVIDINSGGGSPVQSAIIHDKIMALKKKHNKRVIIVGEDVVASGAYLVAMAGDKLYVNQDTITGSIGVVMEGFGFDQAMEKVGITRRVFTAGNNKVRMDPFGPLRKQDIAKTHAVLDEVHQHFIEYVTESRGDRLQGDQDELFSGDFWTGSTALELGIVDGLGNLSDVMQKEFQTNYYVDYSEQPTLIELFTKGLKSELGFDLATSYSSQRLVAKT